MTRVSETPGDTIKAGTLVLLTSGEYSSYSVHGLFRARTDVVIPGKQHPWRTGPEQVVDLEKLSTLLEEVDFLEVWGD